MPIFQYSCEECKKDFEVIIPAKATNDVVCPECQNPSVVRQLAAPAKPLTTATNCRGDGPPCGAPYCGRRDN